MTLPDASFTLLFAAIVYAIFVMGMIGIALSNLSGFDKDHQPTETSQTPPNVNEAVVDRGGPSDTQQESKKYEQRPMRDYERRIVVLTSLIASVTAFYALVATFEWNAMLTANRQTKIALDVSQRAYVHLENIKLAAADNWVSESESKPGITLWNAPRNMGKMIRSTFLFTNAGNTPTRSLEIMLHCELVGPDRTLTEPFDILKWDKTKVIRRSIGAKQTISIFVDSCDFKNSDVLLNAQMHIVPAFLTGEVRYEDWLEPGILHRTQFAHRLVVNDYGRDNNFTGMSVTTEPVGAHNCTDEDCPQ